MSVAKRMIEEQLETNARQEREFEDGAFYWVRCGTGWNVARCVIGYLRAVEPSFFMSGSEMDRPAEDFDEIGPCIGKEPPNKTPLQEHYSQHHNWYGEEEYHD